MARKSAVLTPEGKKEALAQLKNTANETKSALKAAQENVKQITFEKTKSTKDYTKNQKLFDTQLAKAQKDLAKAEARHEVSVKSLDELKAQPVEKPAKPVKTAKPDVGSTVQSALSAPTTTVQ